MRYKLLTLLMYSWLGAVQAAELGDVAPRSYVGQPLVVDIDLLSLSPEEAAGLQVRLADANVYRGANVTMHPALAGARLQVERRGARQVLHVSTTRPVEAEYVHLYLQLGVPGRQEVRLATVWLQPDPNPAPPPQPAVPPASALTPAQAEQITAQARAARLAAAKEAAGREPAGKGATARDAAAKEAAARDAAGKDAAVREAAGADGAAQATAAPVRDRSKPAPLPSMHEAETGVPGEVKAAAAARRIAGVWVSADGRLAKAPTSADPAPVPEGVAQALLPLAPLPLPKGVKRPAAACAPTGMRAKECVALDAHNAEIASKLTELEGKMKVLQGALGGAAPAAVAAPKAAQAAVPAAIWQAPSAGKQGTAASAPAAAAAKASGTGTAAIAGASPAAAATTAVGGIAAAGAAGASGTATGASGTAAGASGTAATGAGSAGPGAAGAGAAAPAASLTARMEPEAHAAKAAAGEGGSAGSDGEAGAGASAATAAGGASAASPPVATKQVRVLPKLKYKKEKPPEPQTDYTMPLTVGGIGLLALLGAGFLWWRQKRSGRGPLKIWQGFRKRKPEPEPGPEDFVEVRTAAQ